MKHNLYTIHWPKFWRNESDLWRNERPKFWSM